MQPSFKNGPPKRQGATNFRRKRPKGVHRDGTSVRRATTVTGHDVMGQWGRFTWDNGVGQIPTNGGIIFTGGGGPGTQNPANGTPIPDATVGSFQPLNAYSFGTRCSNIVENYAYWRPRKVTIKFIPNVSAQGDVATATFPVSVSGTTTVAPALRAAVGITYDPAQGPLTFNEVIEAGGKAVYIGTRTITVVLKSRRWFYTYNPFAPGQNNNPLVDASDVRQQCPCQLNFVWQSITTTASSGTNTFGNIEADWVFDVKEPIDPDFVQPFSRTPSLCAAIVKNLPTRHRYKEESKDSDSPIIVQEPDEDDEKELIQAIQSRAAYRSVITRLGLEALELKDAPKPHKA